jgi:hypothetical protein
MWFQLSNLDIILPRRVLPFGKDHRLSGMMAQKHGQHGLYHLANFPPPVLPRSKELVAMFSVSTQLNSSFSGFTRLMSLFLGKTICQDPKMRLRILSPLLPLFLRVYQKELSRKFKITIYGDQLIIPPSAYVPVSLFEITWQGSEVVIDGDSIVCRRCNQAGVKLNHLPLTCLLTSFPDSIWRATVQTKTNHQRVMSAEGAMK